MSIFRSMDNADGDWSEADEVFLSLAVSSLTSSNVEAGQNVTNELVTGSMNSEKLELTPEKCVNIDSHFETSDNAPLSQYPHKQRYYQNRDSEFDTSDNVPLSQYPHKLHKRRKTKGERDFQQAIAISRKEADSEINDKNRHERRLDNILLANGLERIDVAADGNCFFESCALLLNILAFDIRKCLCDYLEDNFATFFNFFAFGDDENAGYIDYMDNVAKLRVPGEWSNNAGDMLPLALSSWTKRLVRVYSSNPERPILDFYPVGVQASSEDETMLTFALLDFARAPHYNACTALGGTLHLTPGQPFQVKGMCSANAVSAPESPKSPLPSQCANADQTAAQLGQPPVLFQDGHDLESSLPHMRPCENDCSIQQCSSSQYSDLPSFESAQHSPTILQSPIRSSTPILTNLNETPRKTGNYKTPPKKVLTRKKIARPETWKKNIRKALKLQGKAHLSDRGQHVPAKELKAIDCSKCKLKCDRLTDKRLAIFESFYMADSYEKQKQFVSAHVTETKTKTLHNDESNEAIPKTRQVSRQFFLTVDGKKERVCKQFFISTLSISHNYLQHALQHSDNGVFMGSERRGKKRPHNKTPDKAVERVKSHIKSFPTVSSHYTRKDTRREYLPQDLNTTKMHELYTEECRKEGSVPVSLRLYRRIFNENFNISFHVPKKDQCSTCTIYENKVESNTLKDGDKEKQEQHRERIETARKEKKKDKERATKDRSYHVVTVDLQAVLQAPCGLVSQLYYKRKLSVYNFTVYSLGDNKGTCFTWDETEGMRGSCEIATCLMIYLQSLPSTVKEVVIYSDCCGGQNRNQNLTAGLIHAVNSIPNLQVIHQRYLETGHTQMECDSMHAAISKAKEATPISIPSEWDIVLRMARRKKAYTVIPIKHKQFYDFKKLAASFIRNTRIDIDGRRVNWLQIRSTKFCKGQEDLMHFKTDFRDEEFRTLRLTGSAKRSRPAPLKSLPLRYPNSTKLPISKAKHQDLLSLCASGIIPEHHHHFFQSLLVSTSSKDRLGEPDVQDSLSESDTD